MRHMNQTQTRDHVLLDDTTNGCNQRNGTLSELICENLVTEVSHTDLGWSRSVAGWDKAVIRRCRHEPITQARNPVTLDADVMDSLRFDVDAMGSLVGRVLEACDMTVKE